MTHLVGKPFFTHLCLDTHRYTQVMLFCVYLYFLSAVLASENVALRKPARHISTYIHLYTSETADKAVDGNTDGNISHYSCTHSNDIYNTWWKVDLMGFYNITSVQLFTRTDCCWERLQNFEVRVSGTDPTTFPSGEGQQCIYYGNQVALTGTLLNCTRPITGRFVSVFKPADDVLTICEIFVFGAKLDTGTYELVQDNSRLNSSRVTSLTTASPFGCGVKCLSDVTYAAFNVMASGTRSQSGVTCELVCVTEWVTTMTLQAKTGWRAYKRLLEG
ncbi:fucolectin-like [Pomacea canaliculata]|uniref:fucolectin-like n=1 Tax=Pomacea canaliculata TaxID=400727 RepID=UPI000D725C78|nr:fucolectin-like [Pomacea canaliculata]